MRRIWLASLLLLACKGSSEPAVEGPKPRAPITLVTGEHALRIDLDARELVLARGNDTLLKLGSDAFQLGVLPAVEDAKNYDPYAILVPSPLNPVSEDLKWATASRFDLVSSSASAATIAITLGATHRATLSFEVKSEGRIEAKLLPTEGAATVAYVRLHAHTSNDPKEGFYGLGEYFDDVNHRGKIRALQIELDGELESNYNEQHVPIPFLIGTRGWGLFVASYAPGVFGVANEASDVVDAIFGTGLTSKEGLTFHLFAEKKPIDLTRHYYAVTGNPKIPARWALGPFVWRDENKNQAEVEADVEKIRELDLATTAIWIDRPYATGVNTFDFNAPQFPDAGAMIAKIHDLGFRLSLWHTPYLDEKDPSTAALRDEANAKGYYPKKVGVLLNKWGKPIDLTNPAAFGWWQSNVRKYAAMGIEGYKLDYGEDIVPGLTGGRNVWSFFDGSDERTMHAKFQLLYHRVYDETLPKEGGFLLCRHSTWGDQQNVSVIWPGDLDADFSKHREKVTGKDGKTYVAVGGLPASLIGGLTLGPSGFPFYGADTGGYRHSPPDKETFVRWFEQTALSTVMQIGTSSNTVAWEGFDDETLSWYRRYVRLHLRLWPYEWTYAQSLSTDGRAIQRPLGLAFPELGEHPSDEYLFGDALLVAPVVTKGQRERTVVFPPGGWIDWWTGKRHGAGSVTISAPLDTLLLFMAEGSIVPMLRPTIDTMSPTTKPDQVDSYATTTGLLWVRIAPGPASSFVLFDGAELKQEKSSGKLTVSTKDGTEFKNGFVLEAIAMGAAPANVTIDGAAATKAASMTELEAAPSGWLFSPDAGGTLHVKLASGAHVVVAQ